MPHRELAEAPIVLRRPRQGLDPWLFGAAVALLLLGLLSLYSEGIGRSNGVFLKQSVRLVIGVAPFLALLWVNPDWLRRNAVWLYVVNVAMLVLVLVRGRSGGGAQRWLQWGPLEFQPSEMSKLLLVITLAALFAHRYELRDRLSTFLLSLLHVLPIAALVFLQPHLGATLVLVAAWIGICVCAEVPWRSLAGCAIVVVALGAAVWYTPGVLREYQRNRIHAMFVSDDQGLGYQQLRATIALGSGGVTGAGFFRGEQKAGRFIPAQHTDFVFTIIGEEGGLIGACLVLAAFAVFFGRGWQLLASEPDPFRHLVIAGLLSVLAFHTIVNLGMNLRLLPVVGLWLPFMSYGGTALWLAMACVGLMLNFARRQGRLLF